MARRTSPQVPLPSSEQIAKVVELLTRAVPQSSNKNEEMNVRPLFPQSTTKQRTWFACDNSYLYAPFRLFFHFLPLF